MQLTTYERMYEIVIKVITKEFKKPLDKLKLDTNLRTELNLDSLDMIDFLFAVEELYGNDVFDDDENEDVEVVKKRQMEFWKSDTIEKITIYLLKRVNELEKKKGE